PSTGGSSQEAGQVAPVEPYAINTAYVTRTKGVVLEFTDGRTIYANTAYRVNENFESIPSGVEFRIFEKSLNTQYTQVDEITIYTDGEITRGNEMYNPARLVATLQALDLDTLPGDKNDTFG